MEHLLAALQILAPHPTSPIPWLTAIDCDRDSVSIQLRGQSAAMRLPMNDPTPLAKRVATAVVQAHLDGDEKRCQSYLDAPALGDGQIGNMLALAATLRARAAQSDRRRIMLLTHEDNLDEIRRLYGLQILSATPIDRPESSPEITGA